MTLDLLKDFFDHYTQQDDADYDIEAKRPPRRICNYYGATEMMDVTFAHFTCMEVGQILQELTYQNRVS